MEISEKNSLINQLKTPGTYPDSLLLSKYITDDDVLQNIVERWHEGLARRRVTDITRPNTWWWNFSVKNKNVCIMFAESSPLGHTYWTQTVSEDILCKSNVWEELKYHEKNKTLPASPTQKPYIRTFGARLGPNCR